MDRVALQGLAAVEYAAQCGLRLRCTSSCEHWIPEERQALYPEDAVDLAAAAPQQVWLANRDCLWLLTAWQQRLTELPQPWQWSIRLYVPRDFSWKLAPHLQIPQTASGTAFSGTSAWTALQREAKRRGLVLHQHVPNAVVVRIPESA